MVFTINRIIVVAIVAGLFTFLFKFLSDGIVKWRDAIKGAVFTSILFMLGKAAIGYYLSYSSAASLYGAAGSLIVLLVWIYYSSVILVYPKDWNGGGEPDTAVLAFKTLFASQLSAMDNN